jgi:hypothetical protein
MKKQMAGMLGPLFVVFMAGLFLLGCTGTVAALGDGGDDGTDDGADADGGGNTDDGGDVGPGDEGGSPTLCGILPTPQDNTLNPSLKNEYGIHHPGQALIPYPWETSTSIRVLPFDYEIPAAPGDQLSMIACRGQFESASFILNARKALSGIQIAVPNLTSAKGDSIPADAINVRTVKVWYQAGFDDPNMWFNTPGKYEAPELLLKDDSLVTVDYESKTNYLKVTINGIEQTIDISNPAGTFPANAQIHDATTLQPFSLKANENKQIWLTVHVPSDAPAGDYCGEFAITAPSEATVPMNFCVKVLPFELEPSPLLYSLTYFGALPSTAAQEQKVGIDGVWKSPEKYAVELNDMKDHGVLYPTINEWFLINEANSPTLTRALTLRNQAGLPKDHLYTIGLIAGQSTDPNDLTKLGNDVAGWKTVASKYGYQDVYVIGVDEASGDDLLSERPAWQVVHTAGGKVFVAVSNNQDAVDVVGDLLDVSIFAGPFNTAQVAAWHGHGHKLLSYANPQAGVENPEIYRKNYGFALWNAGYDGTMNFAYHFAYGPSVWNDFDSAASHFRDHVFAYPTTDGVIDTIQWEGWREGIDDTRYLASLIKMDGGDASARAIVASSLSKGDNMAVIREKLIEQMCKWRRPEHP